MWNPTHHNHTRPSICTQQTSPSGHGHTRLLYGLRQGLRRLLHKLRYYGATDSAHAWIGSFLSGRSQQVVVDGAMSSQCPVLSGVPQGTVLGPLLFLLFINDIADDINSTIRLFADDCLLHREILTPLWIASWCNGTLIPYISGARDGRWHLTSTNAS